MNESKLEQLRHQHSHRVPDKRVASLLDRIRQEFLNLAVAMEMLLLDGREKSCVQTKLDEARMWACNAATAQSPAKNMLVINRVSTENS